MIIGQNLMNMRLKILSLQKNLAKGKHLQIIGMI